MKHLLLTTIAAVLVGCGPSAPGIPIHDAAALGNIKAVKQHLAAGVDVNAKGNWGSTPLHYAAQEGHMEVAELLIAKGANVNPKNNFGQTLLDFATDPDNPNDTAEIADLLRKHGGKTGRKHGGKAELKAEGK